MYTRTQCWLHLADYYTSTLLSSFLLHAHDPTGFSLVQRLYVPVVVSVSGVSNPGALPERDLRNVQALEDIFLLYLKTTQSYLHLTYCTGLSKDSVRLFYSYTKPSREQFRTFLDHQSCATVQLQFRESVTIFHRLYQQLGRRNLNQS
jgi:hypothetical protein